MEARTGKDGKPVWQIKDTYYGGCCTGQPPPPKGPSLPGMLRTIPSARMAVLQVGVVSKRMCVCGGGGGGREDGQTNVSGAAVCLNG